MSTKATAKTVDEIRERAAEAQADLDRVEAELEADRRAEQEIRAERLREWDERFLAGHDDEQLREEEAQAWRDYYAGIERDPVWALLVRAWAARDVRISRSIRARNTAETLGRSNPPPGVQYRDRNLVSAITEGLRRAVEHFVAEDEERLDSERRKAADGRRGR
jgi:hypothetical protein